jgi:hypothetical protein
VPARRTGCWNLENQCYGSITVSTLSTQAQAGQ